MTSRIAVVLLSSLIASPAMAGDMFTNYWDRYAVIMSNEPVPRDSETSPSYRSQFAVMTLAQARAEAAARAARKLDDRAVRQETPPGSKDRAADACNCQRA